METKIQEEIWKDVVGYEGIYQVSNFGNVKSLDCYFKQNNQWGQHIHKHKGRVLKPVPTWNGRLRVDLRGKLYQVHRLVAMHFIQNEDAKKEVNHIDGNPANNCVSNLEWITHSENLIHAHKNGLIKMPKGKDHFHHRGARKVIDTSTGIVYNCVKDACQSLNLPLKRIQRYVSAKSKKTTLRYE